MTKKAHCIDCGCEAVSHSVHHHSRHLSEVEIAFSCGARQREIFDSERETGSVVFTGGNCRC